MGYNLAVVHTQQISPINHLARRCIYEVCFSLIFSNSTRMDHPRGFLPFSARKKILLRRALRFNAIRLLEGTRYDLPNDRIDLHSMIASITIEIQPDRSRLMNGRFVGFRNLTRTSNYLPICHIARPNF